MSARIAEAAKEEASHVKQVTLDGVQSGAYLYPIKGFFFFISHRDLWRPLTARLAPTITLGLGVTTFMFVFTYIPQVAIQFFTSGPLAAFTAVLLVLSESGTLTMILSKTLLIPDGLLDAFDGTLVARGQASLVARERTVHRPGDAADVMARLGTLAKRPWAKLTPRALLRQLMYLPLNLVPVVGTAIFMLLQGKRAGPHAHARYFQLKNMTATQKEKFIEERRGPYTSFGVVATLLETIPLAGILFAFTNTCGAALWAADLEAGRSTAPELKELSEKAQ